MADLFYYEATFHPEGANSNERPLGKDKITKKHEPLYKKVRDSLRELLSALGTENVATGKLEIRLYKRE
jgi:hypothetical protein